MFQTLFAVNDVVEDYIPVRGIVPQDDGYLERKRKEAKEYLGEKWILHSKNRKVKNANTLSI